MAMDLNFLIISSISKIGRKERFLAVRGLVRNMERTKLVKEGEGRVVNSVPAGIG